MFCLFYKLPVFCKGKSTARQPRLDALVLFPFQLDTTTSKVLAMAAGVQTWMLPKKIMLHFRSCTNGALYSVLSENGIVLGPVVAQYFSFYIGCHDCKVDKSSIAML